MSGCERKTASSRRMPSARSVLPMIRSPASNVPADEPHDPPPSTSARKTPPRGPPDGISTSAESPSPTSKNVTRISRSGGRHRSHVISTAPTSATSSHPVTIRSSDPRAIHLSVRTNRTTPAPYTAIHAAEGDATSTVLKGNAASTLVRNTIRRATASAANAGAATSGPGISPTTHVMKSIGSKTPASGTTSRFDTGDTTQNWLK